MRIFRYMIMLLVAAGFAVPATASAAPGAFTVLDGGEFGQGFYDTANPGQNDKSVSIFTEETVSFNYPVGLGTHNVAFIAVGPQPSSCTQTSGPNLGAVPPLPTYTIPAPWGGNCTFNNPGTYTFVCQAHGDMVGEITYLVTTEGTILLDEAQERDLGILEISAANPGVDPWVPGAERLVLLPSAHLLPEAPRQGIVINKAELRLYYFVRGGRIETHAIGIGREGHDTPEGQTTIYERIVQRALAIALAAQPASETERDLIIQEAIDAALAEQSATETSSNDSESDGQTTILSGIITLTSRWTAALARGLGFRRSS